MNEFSVHNRLVRAFMAVSVALLLFTGCATFYGAFEILAPIPEGVEPLVVHGELVQANTRLFRKGRSSQPAQIVLSLDPEVSQRDLGKLAKWAYGLKGTNPSDPDEGVITREVTNENYFPNRLVKVPARFGYGTQTFITQVLIERDKLLDGYIREDSSLRFHLYLVDGEPYTIRFVGDKAEQYQ